MDDIAASARSDAVNAIRRVLSDTGWSSARLAKEAGIAPSTLFRALDDQGTFVPSSRTMAKIEAAAARAGTHAAAPSSEGATRHVAEHSHRLAPTGISMTSLTNGKARLELNKILPFSVALQILALVEGAEK